MPEMPEVEGLRAFLDEALSGRAIVRGDLVAFAALKTFAIGLEALVGLEVTAVARHGKFLDIDASGVHLIVHLARAGWLVWHERLPGRVPGAGRSGIALRVGLDDDSGFDLTEAGTQRSLAIYVVSDPLEVPGIAALGPDPLDDAFTGDDFAHLLADAGRAQLKGVLRDQKNLAGIGNAYSDEILHAARLSPFKAAGSLTDDERDRLWEATTQVLQGALDAATALRPHQLKDAKRSTMRVHGRAGEACDVCGTTIAQVSFADSALQYCPGCQTGGALLADRRLSKLLK